MSAKAKHVVGPFYALLHDVCFTASSMVFWKAPCGLKACCLVARTNSMLGLGTLVLLTPLNISQFGNKSNKYYVFYQI